LAQSYSFHIHKGDHVGDLHVHVYYNEGRSRKLLGKFRLPSLEPLPGSQRELTNTETKLLRDWISRPEQLKKLQDCLRSTVFDSHRIADLATKHGEITEEGGETYINVRIPVTQRLR
jgi:hypothetical protein